MVKVQLTTTVGIEIGHRVEQLADQQDVSESEIVRQALHAYIETDKTSNE